MLTIIHLVLAFNDRSQPLSMIISGTTNYGEHSSADDDGSVGHFRSAGASEKLIRSSEAESSLPAFYLGDGYEPRAQSSAFVGHPARVLDQNVARFVLLGYPGMQKLKELPCRSPRRPYLIWAGEKFIDKKSSHRLVLEKCIGKTEYQSLFVPSGNGGKSQGLMEESEAASRLNATGYFDPQDCELLTYAKKRADLLFVGYDLSDHIVSRAHMGFKGITVPPPGFSKFETPSSGYLPTAHFFLSFRGGLNLGYFNSSDVRPALQKAFEKNRRADIAVEFVTKTGYTNFDKARFLELLNSSYSLVPHGNGR